MRDIDKYASEYINESPFEDTMAVIRKHTVLEQVRKYKHDSIMEVGCGTVPLYASFQDFEKLRVVEPSSIFIESAKEKYAPDRRVEFINDFLESYVEKTRGNEREKTDFIIVSSLLHEVDDPVKLLQAVASCCGEETVVHINVPNANSIHRILAYEMGLIQDIHDRSSTQIRLQQRNTFDSKTLREMIYEQGFAILDEGSYFIKPFTHEQMQLCIDTGIIDNKVLNGLEKLASYLPEFGAGIFVNCQYRGK